VTRKTREVGARGDNENVAIDNRMWVNLVRTGYRGAPFTYRRFRQELNKRTKGSAPAEATLYRLSTSPLDQILGRRAKYDDIAGLGELAIDALFPTPLSKEGMRIEWLLRSANYNLYSPAEALLLLPEAEGILETMDEQAESTEVCTVDRLARASLGAQIATYKAGARNTSPVRKARLFREAQRRPGGGKAESYNKKAKTMVELILKTAGYTGPVRDFAPDWLKGYRLSEAGELQVAIGLIEASNKE
jgi:hypothetical protein